MTRYTDDHGRQYLHVDPRGFANETTVYAVPRENVTEAERAYDGYEDCDEAHRYTNWLASKPDPDRVLPWSDCPWSAGWALRLARAGEPFSSAMVISHSELHGAPRARSPAIHRNDIVTH